MEQTALQTKQVDFYGDTLLAIHETETQKIYIAINYVLRGLGFSNKQIEYQRDKWTLDKVIAKGTLKFSGILLNAKTGKDMWCITLSKLPLALAKINITPSMKKETPEIAIKLERYQDECADILAAAFLPKEFQQPLQATNPLLEQAIMSLQQSQQNIINCSLEQGYQLQDHEEQLESIHEEIEMLENSFEMQKTDLRDEIQNEFYNINQAIEELKCKLDTKPSNEEMQMNNSINVDGMDFIRNIIKPLAIQRNDKSIGFNATYRIVYDKMGVNWKYRFTKFKNEHHLKNQPKKITLIQQDKKLFTLFTKTVENLLN